jgi:hypothetical protein
MVKRSVAILAVVLCLSLFMISLAAAQDTEEQKVAKAVDWLTSKANTTQKWAALSVKQHALTLLALCNSSTVQQGNTSLYEKAFKSTATNVMCWGEKKATVQTDCRLVETAIAKIASDELDINTSRVDNWLNNRTIFFKDILWFLELDIARDQNATCAIVYDGGNVTLKINNDKKLSDLVDTGNCFTYYPDSTNSYWLAINSKCYEKSFKVRCSVSDNSTFRTTLKYKKEPQLAKPWYVSSESFLVDSGKVQELDIQSYCLANPGQSACDYEGTAWAAYALKRSDSSEYKKYIPYLIIMRENNENLFPETILYLLGVESYGADITSSQNSQGFWIAPGTKYGQFYDTALAGLAGIDAGLGNFSSDKGGAKYYLTTNPNFKETLDKKQRYWKCAEAGCEEIRDTAFLLWIYWPGACRGGATGACEDASRPEYQCEDTMCGADETEVNLTCSSGYVCCLAEGGIVGDCEALGGNCKSYCGADEFDLTETMGVGCTSLLDYCCKGYDAASTCSEFNGTVCDSGYNCSVDEVTISTGDKCCPGTCISGNASEQTCYEMDGEECAIGACMDKVAWEKTDVITSKDTTSCCIGTCIEDQTCDDIDGTVCKSTEDCSTSLEKTTDTQKCCIGTCEPKTQETPKKSLWWLWLLIIVILAAVIIYFLKFRKKKAKKKPPFEMLPEMQMQRRPLMPLKPQQSAGPPMMARPPMRPLRPMPILRPIPKAAPKKPSSKTEAELAKTLKKLKGMTK